MSLSPGAASIHTPSHGTVTLLILGAGWTYQFLHPLLERESCITYAATTSTGHDNTIEFRFDPESDDLEPFRRLPLAEYVLITFPLKGKGPSKKVVGMYEATHARSLSPEAGYGVEIATETKWIQLGSTGVYTTADWVNCDTPIDGSNERGIAEDELIALNGCVLNLAGLYGAQRQPGSWIPRVAKTQEQLGDKGALHLIHGIDVGRAIIAVVKEDQRCSSASEPDASPVFGRRWIISDCVSYDWWQIVWDFNGESEEAVFSEDDTEKAAEVDTKGKYRGWVMDLMDKKGVRGLPRPPELLGRKLDGREFWSRLRLRPERALKR
ncbi:hypothetical protein G647_01540 [Cladophialophora carrionii CBS 160.54]|uniref:Uncharacterized protein n=1 Tax=Cladophialophora carrionii CBS 160.54 TaxID=1279043 RepID=V9DSY8_9EURO|nr:uncharacterized protein G647_01540 [Cladophialophora carrionii CBS 160.54]ETI29087.1 hypothetical protein G647_01540 [Cladophialophora carrionii CBS 160.54]